MKRAAIVLARAGAPFAGPTFDVARRRIPARPRDAERAQGARAARARGRARPLRGAAAAQVAGAAAAFDEIDVERATPLRGARSRAAAGATRAHRAAARRRAPRRPDARRGDAARGACSPRWRCAGVLVDVPTLAEIGRRKAEELLRELESACKKLAGRDFSVRSRDQLEKILFDELELPVVKRTPKGGRSTDADVLEALAEQHELPTRLLEFRELDKLKGTYIDALPRCVEPGDGADPHAVRSGRRGHRATLVERPEPAEHPDPHRARARDPRGVRRAAGSRHPERRLLADRAPRARAPCRRTRARRRLLRRAGTSTSAPRRSSSTSRESR